MNHGPDGSSVEALICLIPRRILLKSARLGRRNADFLLVWDRGGVSDLTQVFTPDQKSEFLTDSSLRFIPSFCFRPTFCRIPPTRSAVSPSCHRL